MFCPECGKELPTEAHFCPSCGHVIGASRTPGAGASNPSQAAAPAPTIAAAAAPPPPVAPQAMSANQSPGLWGRFRAMRTWKKVVLGIVTAIVLLITLAMVMTSGLDVPVDRHFAALRVGNLDAAYSELSIATQRQNSPAEFKAMIEHNPMFAHIVGHTFTNRSWENNQGLLEGTLEVEGGGTLPITVHLVKENDQWKILSYSAKPAPAGN